MKVIPLRTQWVIVDDNGNPLTDDSGNPITYDRYSQARDVMEALES